MLIERGLCRFGSARRPPPAPVVGAPDVLDVGPDEEMLVREYVIRRRPAAAPVVVAPPPVVTAPAPVFTELNRRHSAWQHHPGRRGA
jgi:hypothetical protein